MTEQTDWSQQNDSRGWRFESDRFLSRSEIIFDADL